MVYLQTKKCISLWSDEVIGMCINLVIFYFWSVMFFPIWLQILCFGLKVTPKPSITKNKTDETSLNNRLLHRTLKKIPTQQAIRFRNGSCARRRRRSPATADFSIFKASTSFSMQGGCDTMHNKNSTAPQKLKNANQQAVALCGCFIFCARIGPNPDH